MNNRNFLTPEERAEAHSKVETIIDGLNKTNQKKDGRDDEFICKLGANFAILKRLVEKLDAKQRPYLDTTPANLRWEVESAGKGVDTTASEFKTWVKDLYREKGLGDHTENYPHEDTWVKVKIFRA